MRKYYSKRAGTEVYAPAPQQLETLKSAGYTVPNPEEVITDAGAVMLLPPEGRRAYVVFDRRTGEFAVRVWACTLKGNEYSGLVSELLKAAIEKRVAESADPDRPKASTAPAGAAPSTLAGIVSAAIKSALGGTQTGRGAAETQTGPSQGATDAGPLTESAEEVST